LEKQKEGKRRMRRIGNVDIPNETFAGILSTKRPYSSSAPF
jgi:GTP-binding protein LepA